MFVIVVVGLEAVVIVALGPLTCVHAPVPTVAVLPAIVTLVAQVDWSLPAFAVVGALVLVTVT